MLVVVDEFTRECLTTRVARKLSSWEVIEALADLFLSRGLPTYIRSDNGPEFTAKAVREWLGRLEVAPLFIEPGSPWENGYVESFNARLRDEFLDGEIFYTLKEVQVLTESLVRHLVVPGVHRLLARFLQREEPALTEPEDPVPLTEEYEQRLLAYLIEGFQHDLFQLYVEAGLYSASGQVLVTSHASIKSWQ